MRKQIRRKQKEKKNNWKEKIKGEKTMNKVILIGRLTKDAVITYKGELAIARYTLAVDRRQKGETTADFISCVAFGKQAEFAEKYLTRGTKIAITGRIQTGSYKNKDGNTVYTTDVIVEDQEFTESKSQSQQHTEQKADEDGFMKIPEGTDEELPFV